MKSLASWSGLLNLCEKCAAGQKPCDEHELQRELSRSREPRAEK